MLPPGDAYGSQGLMSWLHDAEKPLAEMLEHLMAYAEQKVRR